LNIANPPIREGETEKREAKVEESTKKLRFEDRGSLRSQKEEIHLNRNEVQEERTKTRQINGEGNK
jgi:hypothetical protein